MGIYIRKILPAIKKFPQHHFYLMTNNLYGKHFLNKQFSRAENISLIFYKSNNIIFEQFFIPHECLKNKIDFLISSGDTGSIINLAKKQILIIHDVLYLKKNSFESKGNTLKRKIGRLYRKICITIASKFCYKIITVSSFAKEDIKKELRVPDSKIHIIKNGIDSGVEINESQFKNKKQKILFVSGSDNQKNINPVLNQLIKDKDLFSIFSSIEVVGISGASEIQLEDHPNVNFHGYLKHDNLNELYKKCSHFIVPSLYESFGIPALEALNSGCMVYSSNRGALPEIMKDKAIFFDPSDKDSISLMIKHLKENYRNYTFEDYSKAKKFTESLSWENSKKELFEFLSSILPKKILVVGDGLIGSSLIHSISKKRNFEIHVSGEKENVKRIKNIFNVNIPTSFGGSGGLGNFWHSVLDFTNIDKEEISKSFLIKRIINKDEDLGDTFNSEFVPFFAIRPKQLLRNINFIKKQTTKFIQILHDKKVMATFTDNNKEIYDKVFVCHGSFPKTDSLVNSGLAKRSLMVSDHLVAQVSGLEYKEEFTKTRFLKKGHLRKYQVFEINGTNFKFNYRPIYGNDENDFSHRDKGIYSKNLLSIFFKMITTLNFNFLKQSFYLRFGLNFPSKNWTAFTQFFCEDSYIYKDGKLLINKDKIDEEISKLDELGLKVQSDSLMSGIHYSNVYSSLSEDISVNEANDINSVILLGSNFNHNGNEKHFTFNSMLIAEKIGKEI
jgi:glycosyltransferase involved in cell wall biosynthesis